MAKLPYDINIMRNMYSYLDKTREIWIIRLM